MPLASVNFNLSGVTGGKSLTIGSTTYNSSTLLPISDLYPESVLAFSESFGAAERSTGLGISSASFSHRFNTEGQVIMEMLRRMKVSMDIGCSAIRKYVSSYIDNYTSVSNYENAPVNGVTYLINKNLDATYPEFNYTGPGLSSSDPNDEQETSDSIESSNISSTGDARIFINLFKLFTPWHTYGQTQHSDDTIIYDDASFSASTPDTSGNLLDFTSILSGINNYSTPNTSMASMKVVREHFLYYIIELFTEDGVPIPRRKLRGDIDTTNTDYFRILGYAGYPALLSTTAGTTYEFRFASEVIDLNSGSAGSTPYYTSTVDTTALSTTVTFTQNDITNPLGYDLFQNLSNIFGYMGIELGILINDGSDDYYFDFDFTIDGDNVTDGTGTISPECPFTGSSLSYKFVTRRKGVNNNIIEYPNSTTEVVNNDITTSAGSVIGLTTYRGVSESLTHYGIKLSEITSLENKVGVTFIIPDSTCNLNVNLKLALSASLQSGSLSNSGYELPDIRAKVILGYDNSWGSGGIDRKPFRIGDSSTSDMEGSVTEIGSGYYMITERDLDLARDESFQFTIPTFTTASDPGYRIFSFFILIENAGLVQNYSTADANGYNGIHISARGSLYV